MNSPIKRQQRTLKHRSGMLEPALINRAVRHGMAKGMVAVYEPLTEQRRRIRLAKHLLSLAQAEFGPELLSVDSLLAWVFGLIGEGVSETHWCHLADSLYSLALFLFAEVQDDLKMRHLCDKMYKSRHEYQRCLVFIEEQRVRERLGLVDEDMMLAAGFRSNNCDEHLSRVREEQIVSRLTSPR